MTATVIPIVLNHKNYEDWSFRMKTYFLAENLWDIVKGTVKKPPEEEEQEHKAWEKKDAKALYAIHNSCGDDTYSLIKGYTNARQAWDSLSLRFERNEIPPDDESVVGEAYPNRRGSTLEEGRSVTGGDDGSGETAETREDKFVKSVESNDWHNAINFLSNDPELGRATMELWPRGTALHYAIKERCSVRIIQQLVELMPMEHLQIQDYMGRTALHLLIMTLPEMVQVAERIVKKSPNLFTILPRWNKRALVVVAQGDTKGERMARYLYSLSPPETMRVVDATQLISDGFRLQRFDITWDLIQRYPQLAMNKDRNRDFPLVALASNRFAFKSGSQLSLWGKLIYYGIRIKPLPSINEDSPPYVYQDPLAEQNENKRHHLISSGMSLFRRLVANLQTLLGIDRIYQIKLVHERIQQFLPLMCKAMGDENMSYYKFEKLGEALCVATEQGHVEYITHLLKYSSYPVLKVKNENRQSLLQLAAECRRYNVYNIIICEFLRKLDKDGPDKSVHSDELKETVTGEDKFSNNMLHTVARITPLSQIDHIQGATLQMQREIQWFKEVESIVEPKDCESVNKDNKTPRKVFKENHKELGKEAEKSMKETATSCTVVGALIVTIMFAAAFTVPVEKDEKTGLPTFLTNKVLTTFIVSDAISLFSSTTSVIMFLGILTSRYSEDDFYKSLPTKMIIGLFTLFLSIATMMIVFSCGLYIMLDGKSSIVIPSILLASVPVTSFMWMQFPLLVELFISTFGQGVFDRKQKNLF